MIRIFNVSFAPATFILLLFESLILLSAFVLATLAVGDLDPVDYLFYDSGALAVTLVVASFLLGLYFQDLYAQIRIKSRIRLVQQLCMVTGIAFLAEALISYLDSDLRVSVPIMLLGSVIAIPGIFLGRLVFGNFAGQMMPQTRLVLIGHSPTLTQLRIWIEEQPDAGIVIEGSAETADEIGALDAIVKTQQPPQLVFGALHKPDPRLAHEVAELRLAGYDVETAAATYERASSRVSLYSLRPGQLIYSSDFAGLPRGSIYRLGLGALIAGICFVVTIPALILTALLLWAANRGPVWRSEFLTGLNGRVFQAHRFQVDGNGALARMMRRFRLDKLPQLLNVLKGEMAIVGPRAWRPEYAQAIERYIPFYRERYSVRPGMTGWAQVQLDSRPDGQDAMTQLEYDLYYIKHMSFGLDTLILLHTIKSMLMASEMPSQVWSGRQLSASSH